MRSYPKVGLPLFVVCALVLIAQPASAQAAAQQEATSEEAPQQNQNPVNPPAQAMAVASRSHNAEVSFFVGGLAGGDLASILSGDFSLSGTLDKGRAYGGRIGYYRWPFGVEGSFTHSNAGLQANANIANIDLTLSARVMYFEANGMLLLIPGPVQPFLTAGGGYHSYSFADLAGLELNKFGWNFGAGLKFNISRVSLRVDIRDHLMPDISAQDLGVDEALANIIGLNNQDLHNVELSFGLGVKF